LIVSGNFVIAWMDMMKGNFDDFGILTCAIAAVCLTSWTCINDTIYALQDREDDVRVGVKSTAVFFGDKVFGFLVVNAIIFMLGMLYLGISNGQRMPYYFISIGGGTLQLSWQLVSLDIKDSKNCLRRFLSNNELGIILTAGFAVDYILQIW